MKKVWASAQITPRGVCLAVFAVCALLTAGLSGCSAPAEEPEPFEATATFTPSPSATPSPSPTPTPLPSPTPEPDAPELTDRLTLRDNIGGYVANLLDGDPETYIGYKRNNYINITCDEEMYYLYICWYRPPAPYVIHINGGGVSAGEDGFVFEFIELTEPTKEAQLHFSAREHISDIRAFGKGTIPDNVQRWSPPLQQADVLIFPAHADDETVFFGALIASCVDRGLDVQVCFMVEHFTDFGYTWHTREQEMLGALWELGVHNYPIIGPFQDHFVTNWDDADKVFHLNDVIAYEVEQIRRFKPLVVVGQDRMGEYGHGAHMICATALASAVKLAANEKNYVRSAKRWGAWNPPKLYLHMAENPIMIDVETPLEHFGGRTAFEVATDAMQYHVSQLQYDHRPMLADKKYPRYDCRVWGLVRSLVGEDTGNDIMENVWG